MTNKASQFASKLAGFVSLAIAGRRYIPESLRKFSINRLFESALVLFIGFLLLFCFSWLLLSGRPFYALGFGGVFVLFGAEHIFNFISRTKLRGIHKLVDTLVQRPISFLLPVFFTLFVLCIWHIKIPIKCGTTEAWLSSASLHFTSLAKHH